MRAATYIMGLGFGLVVYKNKNAHVKLSTTVAVAGWMICIATMLSSLIGKNI